MRRWRTPPGLYLAAAVVLGGALGAGMAGCAPGGQGLSAFMNAFIGDEYALNASGRAGARRFGEAFHQFSEDDGEDSAGHFMDAYKRVRAQYVRPVDDAALIDSALAGMTEAAGEDGKAPSAELAEAALDRMLADLDPHSDYMTPEEFRENTIATRGEFGGLGIEITADALGVKVVAPIADTPAERAGIKTGDIITGVNGVSIEGESLLAAVRRMRGPPGTELTLTVLRGAAPRFNITLERAVIIVRAVRWRAEDGVGYIRVTRFTEKVEDGIEDAVKALRAEIGPQMPGLILDLRSNPGGLLDQSTILSDAFLVKGGIVSVRGRDARRDQVFRASRGDLARGLPMVVLIDEGSASASEIVAGALQDNNRALIMGRRSFGKGSVQTIMPLPHEGALKLTTQLYYTPLGRSIQAYGIEPDVILERPEGEDDEAAGRREADLPGAIGAPGRTGGQVDGRVHHRISENVCPAAGEKEDRMLGCALEYLRSGGIDRFMAVIRTRPGA
ncbi:MAG: S41 family peptidase [Rhodospirillales bacterium]